MRRFVSRILGDRSGATAIEYALIASLIAVVMTTAVGLVGTKLQSVFTTVGNSIP